LYQNITETGYERHNIARFVKYKFEIIGNWVNQIQMNNGPNRNAINVRHGFCETLHSKSKVRIHTKMIAKGRGGKKLTLFKKRLKLIKVLILECVILYAGLVLCGVTTGVVLLIYDKFDQVGKHESNATQMMRRVGVGNVEN